MNSREQHTKTKKYIILYNGCGAGQETKYNISVTKIAKRILSQMIKIPLEYESLFNILKSTLFMSIFIEICRLLFSLSGIPQILLLILLGALIRGILILRFDLTFRRCAQKYHQYSQYGNSLKTSVKKI